MSCFPGSALFFSRSKISGKQHSLPNVIKNNHGQHILNRTMGNGSGKSSKMNTSLLLRFIILSAAALPLTSCVVTPTGWDGSGYQESGGYAQPVVIEEPPDFFQPPEVSFYIAAGVPYDLYFSSNIYYLYSGSIWYTSSYYNGPWKKAHHNYIPSAIRSYPRERIHYYKDNYSRRHKGNGTGQEYKHFRPNRHEMHKGDRSSNRPVRNDSVRPDQGNPRRPATDYKTWPEQGHSKKPDYDSLTRQDRSNRERLATTAPAKQDKGSLSKPARYSPSRPRQGYATKAPSSDATRQDRGSIGKSANNMPGKGEQANLPKTANHDPAGTHQGYAKRPVHNPAPEQHRDTVDGSELKAPGQQHRANANATVRNNPR